MVGVQWGVGCKCVLYQVASFCGWMWNVVLRGSVVASEGKTCSCQLNAFVHYFRFARAVLSVVSGRRT